MPTITAVYLSSLLRNCISLSSISPAKQAHAQILVHGFLSNVTLQTDLLLAYSKCGFLKDGRQVFEKMTLRNMLSWNILIASYVENSLYHEALSVFYSFLKMGFRPDHYTLPPVFRACIGIGDSYLGKTLHGWAIGLGFEDYVVVGSSVLEFYLKCGNLVDARNFFDYMPYRDIIVWNSIISGLGRAGLYVNALNYFGKMLIEGSKMNTRTIPSILNACGGLGDLMKGKEVYGKVLRTLDLDRDVAVENSLIDMYAKCGGLHYSENIFVNMQELNLVTWTTMISCYGLHGKGEKSLVLYNKMIDCGFKPNSVTVTALLASCSHSGLIGQGRRIFYSIFLEYGIECNVEHYACMVDLLARFGYVEEAFELIKNMKVTSIASVWGALLAGCMMQKNVEIGEIAAYQLFELEPRNSSNYVALCSIYDSQGNWEGVSRIRVRMRELGLVKTPGCSWITIAGRVHKFYQRDLSHPLNQMIIESIDRLTKQLVLPEDFR